MKKEEKKTDELTSKGNKINISSHEKDKAEKAGFPGYPHYPASDDIYNNEKEVDLNTEDLTKVKTQEDKPGKRNEKDFREDLTGEDLDVPGSKADEAKGNSGSEDEENNYYSPGGDNHNDLEEDKG
ncbi:MAG: hypothetical protein ACTIJ9_17085 [Aequorivita sp.]